jgi:hypothetical protein
MTNLCDKIQEDLKKNQKELGKFYRWLPAAVDNYVKHVKENKEVNGVSIQIGIGHVSLVTFTNKALKIYSKEYNKIRDTYTHRFYSTESKGSVGVTISHDITKINQDIDSRGGNIYREYMTLYKCRK